MSDERTAPIIKQAQDHMHKTLERLEQDLTKVRAGKASPALLHGLKVDYYGTPTPVEQVANISAADARTLSIQPYEKSLIGPIERAINEANLGVTPQNDGIVIRVTLPIQTEERRKQLVKQAREMGEEAKVAVRNIRRDNNEHVKKLSKDGLPADAQKAAEAEIQKLTDKFVGQIDAALQAKEHEIMTV